MDTGEPHNMAGSTALKQVDFPIEADRSGNGLHPALSWSIAIMLAVLHWLLAVSASLHNATTFDEVAHIAGGLGATTLDDYRLP
jgi:hypothetical protein